MEGHKPGAILTGVSWEFLPVKDWAVGFFLGAGWAPAALGRGCCGGPTQPEPGLSCVTY